MLTGFSIVPGRIARIRTCSAIFRGNPKTPEVKTASVFLSDGRTARRDVLDSERTVRRWKSFRKTDRPFTLIGILPEP